MAERYRLHNIEDEIGHSSGENSVYIAGVPDFWERVRSAPHRFLAIDYDGTLAPFRIAREFAFPLDGVREALTAIQNSPGTSLAILSGRPAAQVRELLGPELTMPIYGAHGYEFIDPDGTLTVSKASEWSEKGLAHAVEVAVGIGRGGTLERKTASVALHTRAFSNPAEVEEQFLRLWRPIAEEYDLALLHFNRGVELRANDWHKGLAFAELFRKMPPHTLPVYFGDDTTDEDVFRYLKPVGIGIKVGLNGLPTEAEGQVPDEATVLTVLQDWPVTAGS